MWSEYHHTLSLHLTFPPCAPVGLAVLFTCTMNMHDCTSVHVFQTRGIFAKACPMLAENLVHSRYIGKYYIMYACSNLGSTDKIQYEVYASVATCTTFYYAGVEITITGNTQDVHSSPTPL